MTLAVPDTLGRTRELVDPALRAAVARLDSRSARLATYHLGWCDADGVPTEGNNGKAVRPALALLSAEAVGAPSVTAIPGAVAVELVHNFSLLHDDLMDGDVERRHRATVWILYGAAAAILAGDALLALATQVLLDATPPSSVEAAQMVMQATQQLIRGQFADIDFETRTRVGLDECLDMAAAKTGALLSCSAAIGAVLAGASKPAVRALATYGAELGVAFQLVDDVLGIWGDPSVTGKPVGSDLRARKRSLPVSWAVAHGGSAGRDLDRWLRTTSVVGDAEIARATAMLDAAGARVWAVEEAERRLATGEDVLRSTTLESGPVAELMALGRFVVTRDS